MRFAQLVIGPAGSGKSTYCSAVVEHAAASNRVINVVNLDPAAEYYSYNPIFDIRDLINVEDVMEDQEMNFGPNGGLVFCMEYLVKNYDWLEEELGEADDDYILFDCPGQIELYTHMSTIKQLCQHLQKLNFRICAVFVVDAQFMVDSTKFISGTMAALSVMINLELPHVNILNKMDLVSKVQRRTLDPFLDPDSHELLGALESSSMWGTKFKKLSTAIAQIIDDYSLVRFHPLNIHNNDNMTVLLLLIDQILQFGEDAEPKTHDWEYSDDENPE